MTTTDELLAMQAEARKIYVDPALVTYAVRLVAATRAPDKAGLHGPWPLHSLWRVARAPPSA